jgi:hypothetical protein
MARQSDVIVQVLIGDGHYLSSREKGAIKMIFITPMPARKYLMMRMIVYGIVSWKFGRGNVHSTPYRD